MLSLQKDMSLPPHYFSAPGGEPAAAAEAPMHPAVLQHLLQQQTMQQQLLLQLQAGGFPQPAIAAAAAAPQPLYAATVPSLASLPLVGAVARSDTTSSSSSPSTTQTTSTTAGGDNSVRLHIANIPYKWRDEDLKKLFGTHGEVLEAEVIFNDRGSKGFAFITMANREGADAAKAAIHEKLFEGRMVEVNPATAKMSARQKAKTMQPAAQHMQLAMLQQQQPALLQPTAADPLQQLLAAQAVLAQYAAQQQMLQALQQPALQLQQQPLMLQQLQQLQQLQPQPQTQQFDLEKHQRTMAEELAKQRYRPY